MDGCVYVQVSGVRRENAVVSMEDGRCVVKEGGHLGGKRGRVQQGDESLMNRDIDML